MTYNELISQIKTIFNKGVAADDDRWSARYIMQIALRKRSRVLKQEQEKKKMSERFSRQRISCMELIEVDKHECNCIPINTTCKVRRTKDKVPTPIKDFLSSVTSIDGSILYSPTTFHNYEEHARLAAIRTKPKYYVSNEYIYIVNDDDKQYISIEGVFENPSEAANISCAGSTVDTACYYALDQEFNISPDLLDAVILLTLEELFTSVKAGQEDKYNDASATDVDYTQLKRQLDAIKNRSKSSNDS